MEDDEEGGEDCPVELPLKRHGDDAYQHVLLMYDDDSTQMLQFETSRNARAPGTAPADLLLSLVSTFQELLQSEPQCTKQLGTQLCGFCHRPGSG